MKNKETDFTVECNVCKQQYDNWVGSTPCCGSIAYRETGEASKDFFLFRKIGEEKL
jgi:hypothetical protein